MLFGIILIIIILLFTIIHIKNNNSQVATPNNSDLNDIFVDSDNLVSLEISKLYKLKQFTPKDDYILELRSDDNLDIFLTKKDKLEDATLKSVASSDNKTFTEKFEKKSNISELKELNLNGIQAYTYSLHYLDQNLNEAYYLQVVWIELDNEYYIFDFEFPLDNLSTYANIVSDTLSNFKQL